MNKKHNLKIAAIIALILTLTVTLALLLYAWLSNSFQPIFITLLPLTFFIISFFLLYYNQKRSASKLSKELQEQLSKLQEQNSFLTIDKDILYLSEEIEKYTQTQKLEIKNLKSREAYRKEFMGNVAHELKTPLFTVQGYIHTLLDGAIKDKTVRKKYLKRASKGVDRLTYIVKDLDLITKLEMGELTLTKESFNIVKLIQNVFDLLEMKASRKEISLHFSEENLPTIKVLADRDRMQQVLSNLIENSIKYGIHKGKTTVRIENLDSDKVRINITDNGEGIASEHLPRIFERFYRVDKSGSRKEGGSGLGLSIVKHILEAHNEKIEVKSSPQQGSTFSFTLQKA